PAGAAKSIGIRRSPFASVEAPRQAKCDGTATVISSQPTGQDACQEGDPDRGSALGTPTDASLPAREGRCLVSNPEPQPRRQPCSTKPPPSSSSTAPGPMPPAGTRSSCDCRRTASPCTPAQPVARAAARLRLPA